MEVWIKIYAVSRQEWKELKLSEVFRQEEVALYSRGLPIVRGCMTESRGLLLRHCSGATTNKKASINGISSASFTSWLCSL
jgi:hypothetical protein